MPRLKKIFNGISLTPVPEEPEQRRVLVAFQEYWRSKLHSLVQSNNARSSRVHERCKVELPLAQKVLGRQANAEDWRVVCATIQWLGTTDGKEFLQAI